MVKLTVDYMLVQKQKRWLCCSNAKYFVMVKSIKEPKQISIGYRISFIYYLKKGKPKQQNPVKEGTHWHGTTEIQDSGGNQSYTQDGVFNRFSFSIYYLILGE